MPQGPVDEACPGEEDIAAFVQGRLGAARTQAIEAHASRCSACRVLLSALARAAGSTTDSVAPTLPMDLAAAEAGLPDGARFGRYVVLEWLGAGGMGVVYSAHDPELNRKVALKVLRSDGAELDARGAIHDLLLREAQAMAQLAHPNVVTVFDVGSVAGRVFIAMELVEGQTLAKWLRAEPRTPAEIISAFLAAGQGLAAAHAAGLVHRDFKPENVLVGKDGRVRVTDFGLARHASIAPITTIASAASIAPAAGAQRPPGEAAGGNTTRSGLVGTLLYMAPEQYLQRSADARADQYSFAVALYEALCGELPFRSPILGGDVWLEPPRGLARLRREGVPPGLRQALLRALNRDPAHRYPSMNELLAAIAPRSRRGRFLAIGAIAAGIAAVASAGVYAVQLRHAAERRTELVGRLRGMAPELRTKLQSAHMLPRHDIRPARAEVRRTIQSVERELQTPAGQDEIALVQLVLGEGYRALGDRTRALALLEASWASGARGPQIDAALGAALGDAYETEYKRIEQMVQSSDRDAQLAAIEQRYGQPAMDHLRGALAANTGSPTYLEALISFHAHRYADAARSAHAAFAASPTSYEAGKLEAEAHDQLGRELLADDRRDQAEAEFAQARQIFERVLEIARSDDEMWFADGEMIFIQADALARGELPEDLRRQAVIAMRTARQINPENWVAVVGEMMIHEKDANMAIIANRDPSASVEQVLALAREARAQGADGDKVDVSVCLAAWERAVYQGNHGVDPRPSFQQAVAACEHAAAVKPESAKYAALGAVYTSQVVYESDHGGDPARAAELGERNLRSAIAIATFDPLLHYNLGRLFASLAHYRQAHGDDPEHTVDLALSELGTSVAMDATRVDARAAIAYALIARARFDRAQHRQARSLDRARTELKDVFAIRPDLTATIKYRMLLAELDAEALLERHADPAPEVARIEADAELVLRRVPSDSLAHRLRCRAQLFAARWALAHHRSAERMLTTAASAASQARSADPKDPRSWTVSAEVDVLRARAARDRPAADAAIASARAFLSHAIQIDPRLVWTRAVADELAQPTGSAN